MALLELIWRGHRVRAGTFLRANCLRLIAYLAALLLGLTTQAQVSREYDLKAVFLLNFAQFVEWPADAFPDPQTPFTIGILGADPFKEAIDAVRRNEKVHSRPVIVRRYLGVDELRVCHILFVSGSESRRLGPVLAALRGRPMLTVSDIDGFARRGGMIAFYTESAKVRLRVNHEAARAERLLISTKLLRVADVVSGEEK